ncbi:hypothetical protein B0H21DRAFT_20879 [Amylocystis lapponica]|nr:hypothetical protein B0H21DRAFT_20879 [Amylocystis lapponica]
MSDKPRPRESLVNPWMIVDDDGGVSDRAGCPVHKVGNSVSRGGGRTGALLGCTRPATAPGTLIFRTSWARFNVVRVDEIDGAQHGIFSILSNGSPQTGRAGRIILSRRRRPRLGLANLLCCHTATDLQT